MKKVTVKIVSAKGHDEFTDLPQIALDKIRAEAADSKKWVYLDGNQVNPNEIGIDDLLGAEDIMLTNALQGG